MMTRWHAVFFVLAFTAVICGLCALVAWVLARMASEDHSD
jgi:hypothetical protein